MLIEQTTRDHAVPAFSSTDASPLSQPQNPVPFESLVSGEKQDVLQPLVDLQEAPLVGRLSRSIVGTSQAMQKVFNTLKKVAPTDATVLITGETGTGKELIARALHDLSPRSTRPFMTVNCAALPASLIESELFGHEKGSFTGAVNRKVGRFERAQGGTIFLDEIGEIPLEVQPKLLRVLQERAFERVGGSQTLQADVRVIAATNRDLQAASQAGQYRPDLYYRLDIFPVFLPPLRERPEDIPALIHHFATKYAAKMRKQIETIETALVQRFTTHSWPGNIRELEHRIERAVILTEGSILRLTDELLPAPAVAEPQVERLLTLEAVERQHILHVLEKTNGVVEGPNGAARVLDLHPNTLRGRMRKLGIQRQPTNTGSRSFACHNAGAIHTPGSSCQAMAY